MELKTWGVESAPAAEDPASPFLARGDFVYRTKPIVGAWASGASIFDAQGSRYIDLEASNGAAILGYDPTILEEALSGWRRLPSLPSFIESQPRLDYADTLGRRIEQALGCKGLLAFELGGTQGIELAIRIAAMGSPNRKTIVVLEGAYHGRSLLVSNLSSSYRYRDVVPPAGYRIVRLPVPSILQGDGPADHGWLEYCKRHAEHVFQNELMGVSTDEGSDALAFIYEPVLNVAGLIEPGGEFLNHVIKLAKSVGCRVIADEVFCGVFRLGQLVASAALDLTPDLLVLGKALTNGSAPLSAVWAAGDLAGPKAFRPGSYRTSFSNHRLHFLLANVVLRRLVAVEQGQLDRVANFIKVLITRILHVAGAAALDAGTNGLTGWVEFRSPVELVRFAEHARSQRLRHGAGLIFASTGAARKRLLVHPPLTISDEEVALTLAAIEGISWS